jgi:hypothetical protein
MPKQKTGRRETGTEYNGRIVGILGTVIIHLIAAIIFMSYKLYTLNTREKTVKKFEIEFAAVEEVKKQQQAPAPVPASSAGENVMNNSQEMLDIARNIANKSEKQINAKDYINQVKEELIQSGRLGVNNYLDQPGNAGQTTEDEELALKRQADSEKAKEEDKQRESLKMAANYKGPTRIYYDLTGRNHTYLPIPIYKCEGSGKIVLLIEVNRRGNVENASIMEGESSTRDDCLVETAIKTAMISRFDPSDNAPEIQKGTLTYIFVAQ